MNMVDWWVTLSEILKITIPVAVPALIGAIGSRFIVNSWQVKKEEFRLRKEKYELRNQILKDFQNSYIKEMATIDNFIRIVQNTYTVDWKFFEEDKKSKYALSVGDDPNNLPQKKFKKDYENYKNDLQDVIYSKWKFFATVRVYFDLKDIDKKMKQLSDVSSQARYLVNVLMYSKNEEEVLKNHKMLVNAITKLRDANHIISDVLSNESLSVPN